MWSFVTAFTIDPRMTKANHPMGDNRRLDMMRKSNSLLTMIALCALLAPLTFAGACNRKTSQEGKPSADSKTKRYALKGKVVSVDKQAGTANIDNEPVAGFMDAMVMAYPVKPPSALDQLQPGDSISADVVVEGEKYWLENVQVTGHSKAPAGKPATSLHSPATDEEVPDFKLINQSGKQISLGQYRGQTLLLTFIYTRCPFPEFCPRVSHEFASIDRQLRTNPVRYGKTHLLSVSFDPAYDTPKVLKAYGFSCAGNKDPGLFGHWEFSAVPSDELPQFSNYFALTYQEEGGQFTHSLSTALISPDGKIFKWYHGADWQAADMLEDIAAASHSAS